MPPRSGQRSTREGTVARKARLRNEPIRSVSLLKMNRDSDRGFVVRGPVCFKKKAGRAQPPFSRARTPGEDYCYSSVVPPPPVPCLIDRTGFSALEREIGAAILEHHLILSGICGKCRTVPGEQE